MRLLSKDRHDLARAALMNVPFNHLFALSVLDDPAMGAVYVDNEVDPTVFLVRHLYGMSLLCGDTSNEDFNLGLIDYALDRAGRRGAWEWLQVSPLTWSRKFQELFAGRIVPYGHGQAAEVRDLIEENTRVNFRFDRQRYLSYRRAREAPAARVLQVTEELYERIDGSVVPKRFWKNGAQFSAEGVGYCLEYEGRILATAFSSFVLGNQLEIGIETTAECRGQGLGAYVCSKLIDHCIDHGFVPIWSCRLANAGSCKLAHKLGFEVTAHLPYFRLPARAGAKTAA